MKKYSFWFKQNKWFLIFIAVFAYVESVYIRTINWQEINIYTFTPDAAIGSLLSSAILFTIISHFNKRWDNLYAVNRNKVVQIFTISLLVYLAVINSFGLILSLLFNTFERNFNPRTLLFSNANYLFQGLIFGGFFISYLYYNKIKNYQIKLAEYKLAVSENKLQQLKSQLNPHFLFNNLNILDQLIEENKEKASEFLNDFAEIYRYVLHTSDKELVNISDEVDFIKQYFKLYEYKYGNTYQLTLEIENLNGFIVPLTLQLLIENAVQHNISTENNPILIKITISDFIYVHNNKSQKRRLKSLSGRGLNNLNEQYKLLIGKSIEMKEDSTNFLVVLPIMKDEELKI